MADCAPLNTIQDLLYDILKVPVDQNSEKMTRVDIHNIKGKDVSRVLKELSVDSVSGHVTGTRAAAKLAEDVAAAKIVEEEVREFLYRLDVGGKGSKTRGEMIALEAIMETVRGEVNKSEKSGIEISHLGDNGIPRIPTHRLAASIGRKILYTRGQRLSAVNARKEDGSKYTPAEVEQAYYIIGKKALNDLESKGFIEQHKMEATIQDYASSIKTPQLSEITKRVPSVSLNPEAFGADLSSEEDPVMKYFRGESMQLKDVSPELYGIVRTIKMINRLSVPENYVLPATSRENVKAFNQDTEKKLSPTLARVRKGISERPVHIHSALHDLFAGIAKEVKGSDRSASDWLTRTGIHNASSMRALFGIFKTNKVSSNSASHAGKNLSKTTPIDDFVDFFDHFDNDGTPADLFMWLFEGANGRLYTDNSVADAHASKFFRHAMSTSTYSVDVNSDDGDYFINKVAIALGAKDDAARVEMIDALINNKSVYKGKMDRALKQLAIMKDTSDPFVKIDAVVTMGKLFGGLDAAELITTLQAAQDIRDSLSTGSISTNYMISSDATASGGQITIMQAIGYNVKGVSEILADMGIFVGGDPTKPVSDVYSVLQKMLEQWLDGDEDLSPEVDGVDRAETSEMLRMIRETLFKGKNRDLSKAPTMTFIYDQGKPAALQSMAVDFTKLLIEQLEESRPSADAVALAKAIAPEIFEEAKTLEAGLKHKDLKKALLAGFIDSNVPTLMHGLLDQSFRSRILSSYKDTGEDLFKVLSNDDDMANLRIFPASVGLENHAAKTDSSKKEIEYTKENLKDYGVTLSKIFEVLHKVNGDHVLTREAKLWKNVMTVSTVHNIDAALLYHAIDTVLSAKNMNDGIVVVHDDIRANASMVRQVEAEYTRLSKEVAMNYDIYEEVLKAAQVYAKKDLKSNAKYTNIIEKVEKAIALKKAILEEKFNDETTSVIGDRISVTGIGKRIGTNPETETKTDQKESDNKPKENSKNNEAGPKEVDSNTASGTAAVDEKPAEQKASLLSVVQKLSSPIIDQFFGSKNSSKIKSGAEFSYNSDTDTITVADTDFRKFTPNELDVNNAKDRETITELLEHEITHSYTVGMIGKWVRDGKPKSDMNFSYVKKAMDTLRDLGIDNNRIKYALNQADEVSAMAEFISIMTSEPKTAKAVYEAMSSSETKGLKAVLERIVKRVRQILTKVTNKDLDAAGVRPELLYSAMNEIVSDGQSMRITNMETALELNDVLETNLFKSATSAETGLPNNGVVSYMNESVVRYINDPVVRGALKFSTNINIMLMQYPTYVAISKRLKGIYDDSSALQEIVHKITNNGINNKLKNHLLSMSSAIRSDNEEVISHQVKRLKAFTKNLSDEDMETYNSLVLKLDTTAYFSFLENVTDYKAELAITEKAGDFNAKELERLQSIVDLNVSGTVSSDTYYNVAAAGFSSGDLNKQAKKWVLLKSIEKIGSDKFLALKKNEEFMKVIKDISFSNSRIIAETPGLADINSRDVGAVEIFVDTPVIRAFTVKQAQSLRNNDWVIVKSATTTNLGIAYRKTTDNTYQDGVFTTTSTQTTDVKVPEDMAGLGDTVNAGGSHRLVLSKDIREAIGVNKDPSQSLVRTMAHNMAISDSETIRNTLLMKETYFDITEKGKDALERIVKAKNKDNPWFLGDAESADYDSLPDVVKARYREAPAGLSNVNGFNKKIKYVRKDIGYWLVGSSESSVARGKTMQMAIRITKHLVSATKIGMVILNPVKIAIDNVSNISYLSVMGVDPLFIRREYANVSYEFNSYKKARNQLNIMRIKAFDNPEKYAKDIKKLENKLERMPGHGFAKRGFVNSLGSEIIMNSDDPTAGFKSDVDKLLRAIFTKKDGKNNEVAKFIMGASKFSVGIEELMEAIAPVFGAVDSGKEFEDALNGLAARFRTIKSEDDIANYLHQFINSPNSEFSKIGAHMTDLTDLAAKETYYRYLKREGMSPKAAELEVIDSFPDFKEGLPTAVKQLSDVGILMFPSYWIRIQKAIYRMVKNKPLSFGTEMGVEMYFDMNNPQIWDQAIINKADSYFGLVHTPWEHWGMGTVLPTNALG